MWSVYRYRRDRVQIRVWWTMVWWNIFFSLAVKKVVKSRNWHHAIFSLLFLYSASACVGKLKMNLKRIGQHAWMNMPFFLLVVLFSFVMFSNPLWDTTDGEVLHTNTHIQMSTMWLRPRIISGQHLLNLFKHQYTLEVFIENRYSTEENILSQKWCEDFQKNVCRIM